MDLSDIKRLFSYTEWANDLATEAARKLPEDVLSGDPSTMRLSDQMQHVANHATLHRGQVVGMIRQLGVEPPPTDLIFYLRREISPK